MMSQPLEPKSGANHLSLAATGPVRDALPADRRERTRADRDSGAPHGEPSRANGRAGSGTVAGSRSDLIAGDDPRIGAAVAGDRHAASELLAALLPRTRNLVRYLVPGDDDVDDFAQAALLEVLRALPRFEGRSALSTWADRITVRETLRRVKRRRLRVERAREYHAEQSVRPPAPSPLDERYQARREVASMLDQLPEAQRHALILHHSMGLSVPEVAEELGVPFDTVKSRLRLAVSKLRQLRYGADDE